MNRAGAGVLRRDHALAADGRNPRITARIAVVRRMFAAEEFPALHIFDRLCRDSAGLSGLQPDRLLFRNQFLRVRTRPAAVAGAGLPAPDCSRRSCSVPRSLRKSDSKIPPAWKTGASTRGGSFRFSFRPGRSAVSAVFSPVRGIIRCPYGIRGLPSRHGGCRRNYQTARCPAVHILPPPAAADPGPGWRGRRTYR